MVVALVSFLAFVGLTVTTLGINLWSWWTTGHTLTWHPLELVTGIRKGTFEITDTAWTWVGGVTVVLVAVVMVATVVVAARRGAKKRGDKAAGLTGAKNDTTALSKKAVAAKAKRLGVTGSIGLPIARTVMQPRELYSSFEDVCIVIAGPRTGKTTSWVVPRILAAPGAVIATSNKRDILDSTRYVRQARGHLKSWIFDPQNIASTRQEWWWNPLTYVRSIADAQDLAKVFDDCVREPGGTKNAYFDTEGRNLVANLLMAASLKDGADITQVIRWLNNPQDDEPAMLLRDHGYAMAAESVDAQYNLVAETRSGVFGTAQQLVSFLTNEHVVKWVTPPKGGYIPHFDTDAFVRSNDTLYLLSQEGKGNATAIVTALTVAVNEAAKEFSQTSGGRVPTPIYICLDEAANVCKWGELPDMYSHFGSRGVCVDTILQSWSQGKDVWGEAGINKLWSASNVKVYGGGVSEVQFLQTVSELIGDHYIDSRQVSSSMQGTSVSTARESVQRRIYPVADLAALPTGRAWVFASTAKAVLCQTVPWYETKLAKEINVSISRSKGE